MNRKLCAILLCVLVATSVALAACQQETPTTGPCLAHSDANKDGKCDNCGIQVGLPQASSQAGPKEVEVTFAVQDNRGTPMANALVLITGGEADETVTVGADGYCKLMLTEGNYVIMLENLPDYHLAGVFNVTVEEGMDVVLLDVINNTPNGTAEKPFFLADEPVTKLFNTNEKIYFSLRGGEGRYLIIENANAEVEYNGQTYYSDTEGKITVRIETDDPKDTGILAVLNTAANDQEITLQLFADPGTADNPLEAVLDQSTVAKVVEGGSVYYQWVATADGSLTVTSNSAVNSISLTNMGKADGDHSSGTQMAGPTEGAASVTLDNIKAGDVIRIQVSVVGSATEKAYEVDFTLTFQAV